MTATLVVIGVLAIALGLRARQRRLARVTAIDPASAEWRAAVDRARATIPDLRELFPAHPGQALVKVAVATGQPVPRELRGIEGQFVDT